MRLPGVATDPDIQRPLMLVMPVVLEKLEMLKATFAALSERDLNIALEAVGTVHSTRFVILEDDEGRWAKLCVLAIFDGTVEDYIAAFARALNVPFNILFEFIEDTDDKPSRPVNQDVDRFIQYVKNRNVEAVNGRMYCAYPDLTALDIWEATRSSQGAGPLS